MLVSSTNETVKQEQIKRIARALEIRGVQKTDETYDISKITGFGVAPVVFLPHLP